MEYKSYSLQEAYEQGYLFKDSLTIIANKFNNNIHENCKNKYIPFLVDSYKKENNLIGDEAVTIDNFYYEDNGNFVIDISHEKNSVATPYVYFIDDVAFYISGEKNLPTLWKQVQIFDYSDYPFNKIDSSWSIKNSYEYENSEVSLPWTLTSKEVLEKIITDYLTSSEKRPDPNLLSIQEIKYCGLFGNYYHLFYVEFSYGNKVGDKFIELYYDNTGSYEDVFLSK